MIKHILSFSFRLIRKEKLISILNIAGLILGLSIAFLIFLYVSHEHRFDRFNEKYRRIYRITTELHDFDIFSGHACYPAGEMVRNYFPGSEKVARVSYFYRVNAFIDQQKIPLGRMYCAEPGIFDILDIALVEGDTSLFRTDPAAAVLSESTARKLFPGESAIGKVIPAERMGTPYEFHVVAVIRDLPERSTWRPDGILPFELVLKYYESQPWSRDIRENWYQDQFLSYVLLYPGHQQAELDSFLVKSGKKFIPEEVHISLGSQPMRKFYLGSQGMVHNLLREGDPKHVRLFSGIALLILLIASINYLILATARGLNRSMEIGMRRVLGVSRRQLLWSTHLESLLHAFLALVPAFFLAWMGVPLMNRLFHLDLTSGQIFDPVVILIFLGTTCLVGLLSGSYYALFLSSVDPVRVLKNQVYIRKSRPYLRMGLIILQLVIFICLLIGTLTIQRQVRYSLGLDPGYDRDNLVKLYGSSEPSYRAGYNEFLNELRKVPGVVSAAGATMIPPDNSYAVTTIPRVDDPDTKVIVENLAVDYGFLETMGFRLKEGRYFSPSFPADTAALVLNETAVRELGIEDPIGYQLPQGMIIGVIKDFYFHSFHQEIKPMVFRLTKQYLYAIAARLVPGTEKETIDQVREIWNKIYPDAVFEYDFYEDALRGWYGNEIALGKNLALATLIAILIACLGLIALSLFQAGQQTRNIGIRKVFGASVLQVYLQITRTFLFLTLVANLVAWPVAEYTTSLWLNNFKERIGTEPWIYFTALGFSMLLVLGSVSMQSLRAARTNPADSIRYE